MIQTDIQDITARFERLAFYDNYGRPKVRPPVEMKDLAYCLLLTHHGYAHEWWKEYTGIIFLAKMIFHKTPQHWHFLYEVIPLKLAGHEVYISKSIPADCIRVIEPMAAIY